MVAREISAHPDSGLDVVGFLDDNAAFHGRTFEGKTVFGACDKLTEITARVSVDEVIIAVPSGSREFVRRVVAYCRDAGVSFKIVPGLIEIVKGPVHLAQIREVHPEDLLGRQTVEFDEDAIGRELQGRRVMVTGAGGSIGGELCRQLARFGPRELHLFGRGENQIYQIEEELRGAGRDLKIIPVIGDIRDADGLLRTLARLRPEFVYHAAAHKHVHYMESYPEEAVKNNVLGTENVIRSCGETNVQRLVMISTDKAVMPAGVMGATKRLAEYLMIDGALHGKDTRFVTVRFGNVLGSRGSVVPLFMRQIRAGGPVTVSHPEASRFFMTLKEACMLVVQASVMGKGGEIFILRMGSPIKVMEIAKDLIALHGLRAEVDIAIRYVGLRDGEKLREDLFVDGERIEDSAHDFILVSRPTLPASWDRKHVLARLEELSRLGDGAAIRKFLASVIPDADLLL